MSDSKHSTVTYTSISSDDGSLDVGSLRVIVLGYDGLPMMPEDPYTHVEATMQEPPPPDFVPEPVYPEFMPLEDDVLPVEEQPLPTAISPTANSPGYITESDPEEDLDEDHEDHEEDPADYPIDRDDKEEEEEEESSKDDDDDDEEDEDEDKEEHLALAVFVPPPVYRTTARMSIQDQTPIPFLFKAEVDRLIAISTPPSSPLTSYASTLPQIPSPPLPVSSPLPIVESPSTSHLLPLPPPIVLPHTRASMAMIRAAAPSTYILASRSETPPSGIPPLLPIPLLTSSPPLLLPSTNCRVDVPEVRECSFAHTARPTRGFRADYGFVGTLDFKMRRVLDREIGYGITNVWEDLDEIAEEILAIDVAEDDRSLMSGQLNLIRRDRRTYARTARLMKSEAKASCEAWVQSMDASDMACFETQMAALQSQQTPARDPTHLDVPEEADSSS
ncbi:hypothetical protein Tco_1325557 [Tanacetum coccineum]